MPSSVAEARPSSESSGRAGLRQQDFDRDGARLDRSVRISEMLALEQAGSDVACRCRSVAVARVGRSPNAARHRAEPAPGCHNSGATVADRGLATPGCGTRDDDHGDAPVALQPVMSRSSELASPGRTGRSSTRRPSVTALADERGEGREGLDAQPPQCRRHGQRQLQLGVTGFACSRRWLTPNALADRMRRPRHPRQTSTAMPPSCPSCGGSGRAAPPVRQTGRPCQVKRHGGYPAPATLQPMVPPIARSLDGQMSGACFARERPHIYGHGS